MNSHNPIFAPSFLHSNWSSEYEDYCQFGEDERLLDKLQVWSNKQFQKETSAETALIQTFFTDLWGYQLSGVSDNEFGHTLEQQYPVEKAGQGGGVGKADAAMGWFGSNTLSKAPQVLCEFKDIRSDLDKPQQRKGNNRSPVKQCADYLNRANDEHNPFGREKIRPTWGIVTDMNEFRLYWISRIPQQYERFILKRSGAADRSTTLLDNSEAARKQRFIFSRIFHADKLLDRGTGSALLKLISTQGEREHELEKKFYFEYRAYRDEMFACLLKFNPSYQQHPRRLVRLTQKLLDRLLFVMFCEDMGAHLEYPVNLLRDLMEKYSQDDCYDQESDEFWDERVKRLFNSMNDGSGFLKHQINRFNGGMFAPDNDLDNLTVPNKVFFSPYQSSIKGGFASNKLTLLYFAGHYNFGIDGEGERAIGLYTLGRIFEQSITDLEIMEAEATNEVSLMKLSKRKTNGVYYTPEWVTAYIVEETLGLRLNTLRKEIGLTEYEDLNEQAIEADHTTPTSKRDVARPKSTSRTGKYFQLLEVYEQELSRLTVLDPACGSGAFLIQALKRLLKEYQWIATERERVNFQYRQGQVFDTAETYRAILAKNLYGVDINAESVEITKLALWLHTVMPGQPLSSLDNNILCGNSIVDSQIETVMGGLTDQQKKRINPFSYRESFKEIFESGGFDVVIGNPPYIKLQNMRRVQPEATEFWIKAKMEDETPRFRSTQTGNYDIYLPFTEQCIDLLKPEGYMGFIQPSVWAVNEYGKGLRSLLHESRRLDRWVDFKSFQIFDEAITYTALQFFTGKPNSHIKLHFAPNGSDDLVNVDWSESDSIFYEDLPKKSSWQFVPNDERLLFNKLIASNEFLENYPGAIIGFRGVETGADSMFHFHKLSSGKYKFSKVADSTEVFDLEDELMKPLASGGDAKRYMYPHPNVYVLFPYVIENDKPRLRTSIEMKSLFPNAWSYLMSREPELRAREYGKMDRNDRWWGYNYPKNLEKMSWPKLGIAQTVTKMEVFFDYRGECYFNNVRVGGIFVPRKLDMWFLLGVLNSPVTNYVFRRIAKAKDNGFFEANKQFIAPLPVPYACADEKQQVSDLAEALQELHTTYRDEVTKLDKRLAASQMLDDAKPVSWIWACLPDNPNTLKKSEEGKGVGLKGKVLTKWAEVTYSDRLAEKLQHLVARLSPGVKLSAEEEDGELKLIADGVQVIDSVFLNEQEAEWVLTQWKHILRTTNVTPSLTAEKLLDALLKLKKTESEGLRKQIVELDKKLDGLEAKIAEKEVAINTLLYRLYNLTDEEISQVEKG